MRTRKDRIIYYDYKIGGFTVGEWLIFWCWQYLINQVNILEFEERINYIKLDMPGALDEHDWNELSDYMKLLSR